MLPALTQKKGPDFASVGRGAKGGDRLPTDHARQTHVSMSSQTCETRTELFPVTRVRLDRQEF